MIGYNGLINPKLRPIFIKINPMSCVKAAQQLFDGLYFSLFDYMTREV